MPAMSEETKAALATLPEAAQKELQGLLEKFGPACLRTGGRAGGVRDRRRD